MTQKLTIEKAQEIVDTQNRVEYLSEHLASYSNKGMDGKRYGVRLFGDSRHFDAKNMVEELPLEDQQSIDRYIVNKIKRAIREGKKHLEELGVK